MAALNRRATGHRWRAKYGGLQVSEAKRLKAIEDENRRPKKLVADLVLDNAMLKDVVGRKWSAGCHAARPA